VDAVKDLTSVRLVATDDVERYTEHGVVIHIADCDYARITNWAVLGNTNWHWKSMRCATTRGDKYRDFELIRPEMHGASLYKGKEGVSLRRCVITFKEIRFLRIYDPRSSELEMWP
jgi:hypothetical protein